MSELCEVRMPTYKRPFFLRRALGTLISQTHPNWSALVMDDSPEREAEGVVRNFGDRRIVYRPNASWLGRAGNIDQAFQTAPYFGGAYAFVLEDDNYLFPDFIAANIRSLKTNGVNIILRNQEIRREVDGASIPMGLTTGGTWFEERVYEPHELHVYLLFRTGISNGGLFWDTRAIRSELHVGPEVEHASFQEMLRCWQIVDKVRFEKEPLCVFTYFDGNDLGIKFTQHDRRLFNRTKQSILRHVLRRYGSSVLEPATWIATRNGVQNLLELHLLDAFYTSYDFQYIRGWALVIRLAKSFLRYVLYPDPLRAYYQKIGYKSAII